MNIELIERLISLVHNSRLSELDYSADGARLHLVKAGIPAASRKEAIEGDSAQRSDSSPAASASYATTPGKSPQDFRVLAGLAGTFYTRPSPEAPPFFQVGDTVQEGDVIGLIEAMKMLNSVEAEVAGKITRVCIKDGCVVASGTELVHIQPV